MRLLYFGSLLMARSSEAELGLAITSSSENGSPRHHGGRVARVVKTWMLVQAARLCLFHHRIWHAWRILEDGISFVGWVGCLFDGVEYS